MKRSGYLILGLLDWLLSTVIDEIRRHRRTPPIEDSGSANRPNSGGLGRSPMTRHEGSGLGSNQLRALVAVYDVADDIGHYYAEIVRRGGTPPEKVATLESDETLEGKEMARLMNDLRDVVAEAEELDVPEDRIVEVWSERLPGPYCSELLAAAKA